jgi:hypothetical protein
MADPFVPREWEFTANSWFGNSDEEMCNERSEA